VKNKGMTVLCTESVTGEEGRPNYCENLCIRIERNTPRIGFIKFYLMGHMFFLFIFVL
jgi:hypothetical protein